MARIVPLPAVPPYAYDHVTPASVAYLNPGEILWIEGRVSGGSVSLRPYYWAAEPASTTTIGGAWIPLGADAVAGNAVAFDATHYGGCANGSYDYRRAGSYVILVKESDVASTIDFVHVSTELASCGV